MWSGVAEVKFAGRRPLPHQHPLIRVLERPPGREFNIPKGSLMFELIGFLIALAAAFWVFSDAKARGLSTGKALLWFLGTLFLLIIFLPFWLLTRPKQVYAIQSIGRQTLCMHCGRSYEGSPNYCPSCGKQITG